MGEPPGQPRLVSHEMANPGWPGSVEDPRPSGCFAKRSGGGSIELLGGGKSNPRHWAEDLVEGSEGPIGESVCCRVQGKIPFEIIQA